MDQYEDEVRERWGDTQAYAQSQSRTSKYTHEDFAAAKVDQEAATELFVYAFGNSLSPDSERLKLQSLHTALPSQSGSMNALFKCRRTLRLCMCKIHALRSITTVASMD